MHQFDPLVIKGCLQRSTDTALTRLDGDGKVGVCMVCAHSGLIYTQFGYGITHGMSDKHAGIVDEIEPHVARFRLRHGVLRVVQHGFEADRLRSAGGRQASGQVLLR